MAANFTIASVSATPGICTENTAGRVAIPGTSFTTWTPTGNYVDGPVDGSTEPVTFQLPKNGALNPFPLQISGVCVVPTTLIGQRYQVVASLTFDGKPVFRNSNPANILGPTEATIVNCKEFTMDEKLLNLKNYKFPFRIAGDFQWKIILEGQPDIIASQTTRLEFAFALAPAPSGPTEISHPTELTMIDMQGVYPVALQRMFFPNIRELINIDDNKNQMAWYLSRTVQTIWDCGNGQGSLEPKYDAKSGAPMFSAGMYGGSIDFDAWWNGKYPLCNCYDLAGMVQLGCSLLLDLSESDNTSCEQASTRWVFQTPTGFVQPCLLYGWTREAASPPNLPAGLNNPFFQKPPYAFIGTQPLIDRFPFGNHAWIEAFTELPIENPARMVFDCTTAVWDANDPIGTVSPEKGTRTREEYITKHIQVDTAADPIPPNYTGGPKDFLQTVSQTDGHCRVNNTAWMYPSADPSKKYRIGVWGISKIPYPNYLRSLIPNYLPVFNMMTTDVIVADSSLPQTRRPVHGPLPAAIMRQIDEVIRKVSGSPRTGEQMFSNSTINIENVTSLLTQQISQLSVVESSVHITSESSLIEIVVGGASVAEGRTGRIILQIHTFNDASLAHATLVHTLSGYNGPDKLEQIFQAPRRRMGLISMTDSSHQILYLVQGNHFVSQRYIEDPKTVSPSPSEPQVPLPTDPEHVTIIAECLSAHLATQEVEPGSQRQPNIHLIEASSGENVSPVTEKTVELGKAFTLYVSTPDLDENGRGTFAALRGATDNGAVVVYSGKPGDAADIGGMTALEFLAIGEGETDIYAYAAHRLTLTPGIARCRVNVVRN